MTEALGTTIHSAEQLRALIGEPSELVQNKTIDHLDRHCREFIARSPFLTVSSSGEGGQCDVSPRGDQPGFVTVLHDKQLVIPERPGNKRAIHCSIFSIIPISACCSLSPALGKH